MMFSVSKKPASIMATRMPEAIYGNNAMQHTTRNPKALPSASAPTAALIGRIAITSEEVGYDEPQRTKCSRAATAPRFLNLPMRSP